MESTNINAVLQQRIALRKKQVEEKHRKEREDILSKRQNGPEYILTDVEQKQLDKDIKAELDLVKNSENWLLNATTDFAKPDVLERKIITYFHQILINELLDLVMAKVVNDESKLLSEDNYAITDASVNQVVVHEKSIALCKEIKGDILPLLLKLHNNTLDSEILVSLATVILALQRTDKKNCLQAYLDLSIGKVIWPIGVQNIGIHFKTTGKEDERDKANFLKEGDWIIALKRIINLKLLDYLK
ncbi:hypothetical protein QEN19_002193 [Hanseniaspora menglaensis]